MNPIYTTENLQDYIKKIERQKEVLELSTVFNPIEKIEILEIYNKLIKIARLRLGFLKDVSESTNL
jgi:hypothetical protein